MALTEQFIKTGEASHIARVGALEAGRKTLIARADAGAARLAPVVAELRRGGITSWYGIAMALNKRGVPTATGRGIWEPKQVRRAMERLTGSESGSGRGRPIPQTAERWLRHPDDGKQRAPRSDLLQLVTAEGLRMSKQREPAVGCHDRRDAERKWPQIVIRFGRETFEQVRVLARTNGVSFGAQIRQLVEFGIDDLNGAYDRGWAKKELAAYRQRKCDPDDGKQRVAID